MESELVTLSRRLVHDYIKEAIALMLQLKDVWEDLVSEVNLVGGLRRPDILGVLKRPLKINDLKISEYIVIEIKTGKHRGRSRLQQVAVYLGMVRLHQVIRGKLTRTPGDLLGLIIRTHRRGLLEESETSVGPIYLTSPGALEFLTPLLPFVDDATENDVAKAAKYLEALVAEEKDRYGRLRPDSPVILAMIALRKAAEEEALISVRSGDLNRAKVLHKYAGTLAHMSNVLARSDRLLPVSASLLVRFKDEITRAQVLEAIKDGRVIFHDVGELIELFLAGIITKEDVKWILEEGYYVPRSIDELLKLLEAGVLTKGDVKELILSGVYIPRGAPELEKLSSAGFRKEEIEELKRRIIELFS